MVHLQVKEIYNQEKDTLTAVNCKKQNKTNKQIKNSSRASLVAQWLRICLLMQGTRVRALVWEDPTCHGAAGPVSHNY